LQYKRLNELQQKYIEETLEVTGIKLTGAQEKIIVNALYISLSDILLEFYVHSVDILEQLVQKDCHIVLVGNLNVNIQEDGCGH
jgi:hypothetical protein